MGHFDKEITPKNSYKLTRVTKNSSEGDDEDVCSFVRLLLQRSLSPLADFTKTKCYFVEIFLPSAMFFFNETVYTLFGQWP